MASEKHPVSEGDFTSLFEVIDFPDAYRTTFLAGAIAGPAYGRIKQEFGLIRAEFVLLACLAHFDEMKAQDIADISQRPRNTVSRAVHRMVDEGYIERAPDSRDGRQALLRITPSGRALQKAASRHLCAAQEAVFGALDADERKVFSDLLLKLAVHASTAAGRV